jgi:hypothetical protein
MSSKLEDKEEKAGEDGSLTPRLEHTLPVPRAPWPDIMTEELALGVFATRQVSRGTCIGGERGFPYGRRLDAWILSPWGRGRDNRDSEDLHRSCHVAAQTVTLVRLEMPLSQSAISPGYGFARKR